jgi:Domain of unknown function (DUF4340)
MSPRVTLGLLAVLLALGGYVYFSDSPGQASPPAAKDKPADPQLEVLQFDDRNTQRLTVEKGGQRTVVEKDANGNWTLQPSGEPADRSRLNGILLRLSGLRATRRFAESPDLADYGLAAPETSVTVTQADGSEYRIEFGARAPAEAGVYARRDAEPAVFLVSAAILQDVERLISEPPLQPTPTPAPTPTVGGETEPTATPTP